jgi:hypothetical protein
MFPFLARMTRMDTARRVNYGSIPLIGLIEASSPSAAAAGLKKRSSPILENCVALTVATRVSGLPGPVPKESGNR